MVSIYFGAVASMAEKRSETNYVVVTTPAYSEYIHKGRYAIEKASELQALYNNFVNEVKEKGGKCFYVAVQLGSGEKIRGFEQAKRRLGDRITITDDYFSVEVS